MDKHEEAFATQLQLRFSDPIQYDYEVIRPVVLFARPVSKCSRETESAHSTVGDKARRFTTGDCYLASWREFLTFGCTPT